MTLALSIATQFPELAGLPVGALGSGTDHDAFLVGDRHAGWVFRVPKRDDVAAGLAREVALLPGIARSLPLAVPAYRFVGVPDAWTPRPFAGYPIVAGEVALGVAGVDPRVVGSAVGAFLRALHPRVVEARRAGIEEEPADALDAWRDESLEAIDTSGDALGDELAAWARSLVRARPEPRRGSPCLVHGDLAAEHVLVDPRGVPTGVIDWSDCALGDVASDLAGLVHWGGAPMLDAALEAYGPVAPGTIVRARWLAACRALADVGFGRDEGRPVYVAAGLTALRRLRGSEGRP